MDAGSEMRRLIDLLKDKVSDKPIPTAVKHVEVAIKLNSELIRRIRKQLMLKQGKINKAALRKQVPSLLKPKVVKSCDKPSSVTTDAPALPTGNQPTSNSYSAGASFAPPSSLPSAGAISPIV